jgi:hypothetical protein
MQNLVDADLKIIALFQNPTVKALARFLNDDASKEAVTKRVYDRAMRQREALARQKQMYKGIR